jgi:hypothetical protein
MLGEKGQHGLNDDRINRRRGRMIEINDILARADWHREWHRRPERPN